MAKISPAGKIIWAVSAGGNGADAGTGIAVDAKGNSYITGSFNGSAKFGAVTLKTLGTNDIFVAKLDGNGQFLWALFTQGTTKDMVSRIAVDGAGQAYITGYISGKVAASGASFVWIKYTDGVASSIALDSAGNSYIAGYFSGKVQFGSTNFTAVSSGDAFVARINAKGTVDMAVQAQGQSGGFASASAIDINKAGQLALAGGYHGTYAFGGTKLTSPGPGKKEDLFVARLNTKGTFQWAVSAGGSEQDSASSVAIDPAGGVHVAGSFAGSAKFGSTSLQATGSAGKSDVFSAQLSPTGAFLRAIRAGGNDMDSAAALGLDAAGYAYLLGVYQGSAGFGPSSLSSKGGFDVFLARLDLCGKF